jgi:predicted MFS family arabinose efflux permease
MVNTALPNRHLLLMTLGLTYIAIGMLGALPGASLIRLASNTHVSLEVAGSMFTISALGSMLGIVLSGSLMRYIPRDAQRVKLK